MFPHLVQDYYMAATEQLRREVNATPDDTAIGMDINEWAAYLIEKYGMELILLDNDREVTIVELPAKGTPALRIDIPVVPSTTLQVIAEHGLAGSPAWLIDYKQFSYDDYAGIMSLTVQQEANEVLRARERILEYIQSLNNAIENANKTFPTTVQTILMTKHTAVKAKHQQLDALSQAVGIPLIKQTELSKVVPTAVKVRETIVPLMPPKPKMQERPVLEREKFGAILELIDNQCRQFERTPGAFQSLTEESLRDIILSSLNALFRGAAVGEAFQGLGKVDIHLWITQGEVFIAEIKFWSGPSSLTEVIRQLLERLTWRDAYGVAIVLSRNTDFGQVLRGIEEAVQTLEGFVPKSLRKMQAHHFTSRFTIPSDVSKQAELHILAYNLYTTRSSGRAQGR